MGKYILQTLEYATVLYFAVPLLALLPGVFFVLLFAVAKTLYEVRTNQAVKVKEKLKHTKLII